MILKFSFLKNIFSHFHNDVFVQFRRGLKFDQLVDQALTISIDVLNWEHEAVKNALRENFVPVCLETAKIHTKSYLNEEPIDYTRCLADSLLNLESSFKEKDFLPDSPYDFGEGQIADEFIGGCKPGATNTRPNGDLLCSKTCDRKD